VLRRHRPETQNNRGPHFPFRATKKAPESDSICREARNQEERQNLLPANKAAAFEVPITRIYTARCLSDEPRTKRKSDPPG